MDQVTGFKSRKEKINSLCPFSHKQMIEKWMGIRTTLKKSHPALTWGRTPGDSVPSADDQQGKGPAESWPAGK
jgi:hypothetical protein